MSIKSISGSDLTSILVLTGAVGSRFKLWFQYPTDLVHCR